MFKDEWDEECNAFPPPSRNIDLVLETQDDTGSDPESDSDEETSQQKKEEEDSNLNLKSLLSSNDYDSLIVNTAIVRELHNNVGFQLTSIEGRMFAAVNKTNEHWLLLVRELDGRWILYDSMWCDEKQMTQFIRSKLNTIFPDEEFDITIQSLCHQENGFDCGLFVCIYASLLSKHPTVDLTKLKFTALTLFTMRAWFTLNIKHLRFFDFPSYNQGINTIADYEFVEPLPKATPQKRKLKKDKKRGVTKKTKIEETVSKLDGNEDLKLIKKPVKPFQQEAKDKT